MQKHHGDNAILGEKESNDSWLEDSKESYSGEGRKIKEDLKALQSQF